MTPRQPARKPDAEYGRKPRNVGSKRSNKTRAADIRLAERRSTCIELRRSGIGYERIAELIKERYPEVPGFTAASAYRDVRYTLDKLIEEPARELLSEELDRLLAAQNSLWGAVRKGHLGAIDRLLKIMDRRARYLGLDSPIKQQLVGPDGGPILIGNVEDPASVQAAAVEALDILDAEMTERRTARNGKAGTKSVP